MFCTLWVSSWLILLVCDLILNLLPAVLPFRNRKGLDYGFDTTEADDQVFGRGIVREPHVGFRWTRIRGAGMGMINGQQSFAAVAHLSLRGEQVFRRSFVA